MSPGESRRVDAALAALGVRNLLLGIHDPAFPGTPGEDLGRGTPYGRGGRELLAFARGLGFTGLQLGPQGRTSPGNASPYDGTLFSRSEDSLALAALTEGPAALVRPETLERALATAPVAALACAGRPVEPVLAEAWHTFSEHRHEPRFRDLAALFARFCAAEADWLQRDGLYAALSAANDERHWRAWPEAERGLWDADPIVLRAALDRHAPALAAYAFSQFLLHQQHADLRRSARDLGLALFGDLQVGISQVDVWSHRKLLLADYVMGAPPSRTNRGGQAWNYPILDPAQYTAADGREGPALRFLAARLDRVFTQYDAVRIDHPHGLVCPWVYPADAADPDRAVALGARLFESPDLADHPRLARHAIARPEQLRRQRSREADDWVEALDDTQVARYALAFDTVVAAARRHGRAPEDLACEVLSTQPYPLRRVMERHGLGRFRVTQKVALGDPADVYRTENAQPRDWLMPGSHDTPTLWQVTEQWVGSGRGADHAAYLASRLRVAEAERGGWIARVGSDPRSLAQAKLAELFVGPARNVMLFFTDLFGYREPYNRPGTVGPHNWSLRLGPDFVERYAADRARRDALDLPAALATALAARASGPGSTLDALATALRRGAD